VERPHPGGQALQAAAEDREVAEEPLDGIASDVITLLPACLGRLAWVAVEGADERETVALGELAARERVSSVGKDDAAHAGTSAIRDPRQQQTQSVDFVHVHRQHLPGPHPLAVVGEEVELVAPLGLAATVAGGGVCVLAVRAHREGLGIEDDLVGLRG
jgi:hypothetical protein